MRRCYLVCYDIHDARRLRKVHKVMKGYGEWWQYSIFFCTLKPIDRVRMQRDLEEAMNLQQDQILILDLGDDPKKARTAAITLGPPLPKLEEGIVVV